MKEAIEVWLHWPFVEKHDFRLKKTGNLESKSLPLVPVKTEEGQQRDRKKERREWEIIGIRFPYSKKETEMLENSIFWRLDI